MEQTLLPDHIGNKRFNFGQKFGGRTLLAALYRDILPDCSETFTALFRALFKEFDLVISIQFHENILLNKFFLGFMLPRPYARL